MYVFSSVVYYASLCTNGCIVFILLYVQFLDAHACAPEDTTLLRKQFKSTNQSYMEADSQIPKSPAKCCCENEWFFFSETDRRTECVELPPNLVNFSLKSNWFQMFSRFGIVTKPSCMKSDQVELWTKSNAANYHYFPDNKTVYSLVTKRYFKVACSDFINLNDYFSNSTNYDNESFKELENEISQHFLCSIPEESTKEKIRNFLSFYGMATSNFILALTFYLYASTPKLRRKVYDICFLCQLATFIVAFAFTIWRHQLHREDEPATSCTFVAYMNQYWLLSAFSWLTILCIDLWRAITARKSQRSDSKKLLIYSLCAWGFPLLMTFATFHATQLEDESHFKVDFYQGFCWFQNTDGLLFKQPEFIYFYSYLSLTILINLCLFIHISIIIITNDYCWRKAEDSRKHEANKKRFCIYLKLFLIMGLTWLLEVISYYFDNSNGWFWLVLDLQGNVLQGIFIFFVSVCNVRVKAALKERFFSRHKLSLKNSTVLTRNPNSERSFSYKVSGVSLKLIHCQE